MFEVRIDVFECKSGVSKKGNAYHIALVKFQGGAVGKIFSDVSIPTGNDLLVKVDLSTNQEMFLTPRIKSVSV